MLFDRHYRRTSGQKRARRKNQMILLGLIALLLLVCIPLLARFGPLPDSLDYWKKISSAVAEIRWPWAKPRASLMPAETAAPTPQVSSFSSFDSALDEPLSSESAASMEAINMGVGDERAPQKCHLEIFVSNDLRKVEITQQISYRNQTDRPLTEVMLRFPGAERSTTPDAPFSRVVVDGLLPTEEVAYDRTAQTLRIPLGKSLLPESEARIILAYSLTLPDGQGLNAVSSGSLRMASFYAYPAYFQGGAWLTNVTSSLPAMDMSVNITVPNDTLLLGSGSVVRKTNLADGSRTQFGHPGARNFAIAVDKNPMSEERVVVGAISANTYSEGSSTVIRINELTNAILQQYSGRFGALTNNITLISASLDTPYLVANPLIFFDKTVFSNNNEFRYQFARALAELYFPSHSGYDNTSTAFNDLLTHQLAANYVVTSQGATQSDFAYAHCPEARDLSGLIAGMEPGIFDTAIATYRLSSLDKNADINQLYGALDVQTAAALKRIVDAYAARLASGAPAPSLMPQTVENSLNTLSGVTTPMPQVDDTRQSTPRDITSEDEAPGLPDVGSTPDNGEEALDLPEDPAELPPGIDSLN